MRIAVGYANIQNGGRDSKPHEVVQDAYDTAHIVSRNRFTRRADLLAFNEIVEPEDKVGVLEGLGRGYDHAHISSPNPEFWKQTRFREVDRNRIELSPKWPGENPARYLCSVTLQPAWTGKPEFDFHVIHQTNGGFNNEHARTRQARRIRWRNEDLEAADHVEGRVQLGRPQIIVGDFNKVHVNRYHPRQVWVLGRGSIIKMAVISSPTWEFRVLRTEAQHINSDKPALGMVLDLKRRKR